MLNRLVVCAVASCGLTACSAVVPLNYGDDGGNSLPDGAEASFLDDGDVPVPDTAPCSSPVITINPTVYRFAANGTTAYPFRAANDDPNWIDAQDCEEDIILQFNLSVACLPTSDTLQVWAGTTDCSQPSAREPGDGPYCWQVASGEAFANSAVSIGDIHARDITRFLGAASSASELGAATDDAGTGACNLLGGATSKCSVPIALYFMYLPPDPDAGATPDSFATYALGAFLAPEDGGACRLPSGT